MKFDFVVPVYKKSPEVFRRCIKSLLSQTYKDISVRVVFDGPHPELWDVLKTLPVTSVHDIDHGGACKARNAGLTWCNGDFVSFWDADCVAEPEMVSVWAQYLKRLPEADFCYSGYKWLDRPDLAGFDSEPFDPWTINKYNYIASMFPIRRSKCPQWDENLEGLQDWDFWRRVVNSGCKGVFIPGYGFATELPTETSISGPNANVQERLAKVREKHGDVLSDTLIVASPNHRPNAIQVAKALNADYFNNFYWKSKEYKNVIQVGFNPEDASLIKLMLSKEEGVKKAIYWTGNDADVIYAGTSYKHTKALRTKIESSGTISLCDDKQTKETLADIGVEAQVVRLPAPKNVPFVALPEKFKVLVYTDEAYKKMVESVMKSMPDVECTYVLPGTYIRPTDYTMSIQFTMNPRMENGTRTMLLLGRHLISNVQEPYCGFVSTDQPVEDFKREIVRKVREVQAKPVINEPAMAYCREQFAPEVFKEKVEAIMNGEEVKNELQVVS